MAWSSSTGWNPLQGWNTVAAAAGFDAATIAWVNAVNAAAGSSVVSGTNKTIVDTMIKALKTDSSGDLFAKCDRLWLLALAGESTFEAQVDIVNLQSWVSHGSFTLDGNGFSGNGSTGYLDTVFVPSTGGGNFTHGDASFSCAILTNRTISNNITDFGTYDGGSPTCIQANAFSAGTIYNFIGFGPIDGSATTAKGFSLASNAAGAAVGYLNGSSVGSASGTLGSVATTSLSIGGLNNAGTLIQGTTDQIVAVHMGGGLSATQALHFTNTVNAALTSLGVNVF